MPTCHICKKEEIQYRCPDCGRLVCKDCICEGLCTDCYREVPIIPKGPEVKTAAKDPYKPSSCAANTFGLLFPFLAIPIGLIIMGVEKDEEKKQFGKDSVCWGVAGTIIYVMIIATINVLP